MTPRFSGEGQIGSKGRDGRRDAGVRTRHDRPGPRALHGGLRGRCIEAGQHACYGAHLPEQRLAGPAPGRAGGYSQPRSPPAQLGHPRGAPGSPAA